MSQLYVDSDKPANVVSPQIVPETSQKTSIYKCENILVSALRDRKIGLLWKDWSHRTVEIFSDGILHWEKASRTKVLDQHILRLKKVEITLMTDTNIANEEINTGVTMKCQTIQGSDTSIRLIFNQLELDKFLTAVRQVADDHNIERMANTKLDIEANKGFTFQIRANSSIMRRAVTSAMDRQSRADRDSRIVAKRVVMKWLPVLGANDLIHGSWWFVIGSIGILLTCIVVIVNKYYEFLSDDDSTLNKISFVTNWILLAISGFFSTLGSLAFVRAFHEDPPMTPLFPKWYHFQSDELLASWLFFLMTVPFVPYCLIYLSDSAYGSLLYLIALALAVVACLGTLLFVRSCYPSDRVSANKKRHCVYFRFMFFVIHFLGI